MKKGERIIKALLELGFQEVETSSTTHRVFSRPRWLVEWMAARGIPVGLAGRSLVFVGAGGFICSGPIVTTSRALDAGTTITRWQRVFNHRFPERSVKPWRL